MIIFLGSSESFIILHRGLHSSTYHMYILSIIYIKCISIYIRIRCTCRFLYRSDSSRSSLFLTCKVYSIYFSSLIHTVLTVVEYIFTLHSLSISPSDTFFSLIFFMSKPILTIPSSVGRPPLESFESKMCLYEFEEKKIIKKNHMINRNLKWAIIQSNMPKSHHKAL